MPKIFIKNRILVYTLYIAGLALLVLLVPSFLSTAKNISQKIISCPIKICSKISEYFLSKNALLEDNHSLRGSMTELSIKLNQFKDLYEENKRLRDLLAFKNKIGFETVSAEIIARNPNDWLASFVIDRGRDSGIEKGSAVCISEGLLGRINEVSENTSSVMLIAHPRFRIGGMIKNTRIHGIIVGEGNGYAKMLYLPINEKMHIGSVVVTSGYSRVFPKGISIGKIVSVEKSSTGLYKCALIEPAANPFSQEEVLCIK